jgi:hypothetical protein
LGSPQGLHSPIWSRGVRNSRRNSRQVEIARRTCTERKIQARADERSSRELTFAIPLQTFVRGVLTLGFPLRTFVKRTFAGRTFVATNVRRDERSSAGDERSFAAAQVRFPAAKLWVPDERSSPANERSQKSLRTGASTPRPPLSLSLCLSHCLLLLLRSTLPNLRFQLAVRFQVRRLNH